MALLLYDSPDFLCIRVESDREQAIRMVFAGGCERGGTQGKPVARSINFVLKLVTFLSNKIREIRRFLYSTGNQHYHVEHHLTCECGEFAVAKQVARVFFGNLTCLSTFLKMATVIKDNPVSEASPPVAAPDWCLVLRR